MKKEITMKRQPPKNDNDDNKVEEVVINDEEMLSYIKENFPGPKDSTIDVRHLWHKYYRINYWLPENTGQRGRNITATAKNIVHSIFVAIEKVADGFISKECK